MLALASSCRRIVCLSTRAITGKQTPLLAGSDAHSVFRNPDTVVSNSCPDGDATAAARQRRRPPQQPLQGRVGGAVASRRVRRGPCRWRGPDRPSRFAGHPHCCPRATLAPRRSRRSNRSFPAVSRTSPSPSAMPGGAAVTSGPNSGCSPSSLAAVTSTSWLASATPTRVALERPGLRTARCVASSQAEHQRAVRAPPDTTPGKSRRDSVGQHPARAWQDFAGSPPTWRPSAFRSGDTDRQSEREVYLAAALASTLSWVPLTYRPLSDTRKMTASLMSSGSAHAIGMALIPLNASATSTGTFPAP